MVKNIAIDNKLRTVKKGINVTVMSAMESLIMHIILGTTWTNQMLSIANLNWLKSLRWNFISPLSILNKSIPKIPKILII